MSETDIRVRRIAEKLAAVRAMPQPPEIFGADAHDFELAPPLPEAAVADFEAHHRIVLPEAYRLFVTRIGSGGAGPGYRLYSLAESCGPRCHPDHLAQSSPYLPGPRYLGDWEERHEQPPGFGGPLFLRGTMKISGHGCSLYTRLVVTGPARGRLFNLDDEGPAGPYVVEDTDFLAWYERWLDEAVAGYDCGWFGERLPLDQTALLAALSDDPSAHRRARAGQSLLRLPTTGDHIWAALADAATTDPHPTVRAELWRLLRWRSGGRHQPDTLQALSDDITRHAKARNPVDLHALDTLDRLTIADALAELVHPDLEQRRRAAYHLAGTWWLKRDDLPYGTLDDAVRPLLGDPDPLLRAHGVTAVRRYRLTDLHALVRELQQTDTDAWVQEAARLCLPEHHVLPSEDFLLHPPWENNA
ncbi:hypothetical protein Cs7R123_07110 [Catellatospora sp. TT07R-123]|uniref:hypothetical protein n=1 Tax=Catellatospora sp. TT07R-123 TaxID=2733863 RepID=UPI001B0646F4|nr:hypothetical protein [Catellatospora sp. TT07R-123]GHJ43369.1 hypothetical protein Cs7R123_07110 [Catellatospora sp. TT07R-123]